MGDLFLRQSVSHKKSINLSILKPKLQHSGINPQTSKSNNILSFLTKQRTHLESAKW